MRNMISLVAGASLLLFAACSKTEPSAQPAGSVAAASTATGSPAAGGKLVTVDLSSAGEAYKGISIKGPGSPHLLNKPGDAVVQWSRSAADPKAPQFMVTIGEGKLDVAEMKSWVVDWAKGFSTPGKLVYVTDKPGELEYSVELKDEDGKVEMAYGYGVEVKVGTETFSCHAPNLEGADLPTLKDVCRSLAKK